MMVRTFGKGLRFVLVLAILLPTAMREFARPNRNNDSQIQVYFSKSNS
jgi:hypothetical protein